MRGVSQAAYKHEWCVASIGTPYPGLARANLERARPGEPVRVHEWREGPCGGTVWVTKLENGWYRVTVVSGCSGGQPGVHLDIVTREVRFLAPLRWRPLG